MKGFVLGTMLFLGFFAGESVAKVPLARLESVDVEFYCTNEKDARMIGESFERDGTGGGNDPFEIGDEATWIPSDFPHSCNGVPSWAVVRNGPVTLMQIWRRKDEAMALFRRDIATKASRKNLFVLTLGHDT